MLTVEVIWLTALRSGFIVNRSVPPVERNRAKMIFVPSSEYPGWRLAASWPLNVSCVKPLPSGLIVARFGDPPGGSVSKTIFLPLGDQFGCSDRNCELSVRSWRFVPADANHRDLARGIGEAAVENDGLPVRRHLGSGVSRPVAIHLRLL